MRSRKRQQLAVLNGDVEILASASGCQVEEVRQSKQHLACEVLGLTRTDKTKAGEGKLEDLFESPAIPRISLRELEGKEPGDLKFMPRPTGLSSVDALFAADEQGGWIGTSSSQTGDDTGMAKGWPAASAIEIFDYTSGGGQATLLCSTAVACAKAGMKVMFFDSTNSIKGSVFDKFMSSLVSGENKEMYKELKSKTGELYDAIKVVHVNDIWDLIDKLALVSSTGSNDGGSSCCHFVGIVGLSRMIAELDPNLLYQTIADRQKSSGRVINSGEPSMRALLHRLGITIRGLTATGSTVITFSTPIDAEHRKYSGIIPSVAQFPSSEGYVCLHDVNNLPLKDDGITPVPYNACSCVIVRMAFIRIFKDVFDITMDLAPSPPRDEMILSFKNLPRFVFDSVERRLHCTIQDPSIEGNV